MRITEVRIKLMDDAGDRLRAFCSIPFDDSFVVRDLKTNQRSRLTEDPGQRDVWNRRAAWSPDGKRLASVGFDGLIIFSKF